MGAGHELNAHGCGFRLDHIGKHSVQGFSPQIVMAIARNTGKVLCTDAMSPKGTQDSGKIFLDLSVDCVKNCKQCLF